MQLQEWPVISSKCQGNVKFITVEGILSYLIFHYQIGSLLLQRQVEKKWTCKTYLNQESDVQKVAQLDSDGNFLAQVSLKVNMHGF